MNPSQLSYELRKAVTPHLTRRRWIIGLSFFGAAMAQLVALYQTGIIKRLPDPPLPLIDSNKVDASTYAYKRRDTPDGLMMLSTYATTALLAGAGGKDRVQQKPWLPLAMGAKLLYDTVQVVRLGGEEWAENKALCFYCQTASLATLASLLLAIPEVTQAAQKLWSSGLDQTTDVIEEVKTSVTS
ncbi:MAG: vitamin K epoxide reductase family protein [Caldilineaceae bacterium]